MASTICDHHDEPRLDAPAPVGEQRLVDVKAVPPVESSEPAGDQDGSRSGRRPSWISAGAALVVVALIITVVSAWALISAGEMGLPQVLAWCLILVVALVMAMGLRLPNVGRSRRRTKRVAVIGSQVSLVALNQEMATNQVTAYTSVGWIAAGPGQGAEYPMPQALGSLSELGSVIDRHQIDLLLIGPDVPRLAVFDELVRLTDIVGVRVCELAAFYEDAFGHIPVTEINSAWFQYVMHPKFRPTETRIKRFFDVGLSAALGIAVAPLLLLAAVLVKLDGGPVLYRQRRIGEKGRVFTIYKLRTMRERPLEDVGQTWCSVEDPRVTPVGRVLRRLHIDELPQLYNVLRGEMSVVGPRPEQPDIVAQLETRIAFYSRRHLIKPGLAGWAQLQCGYARSERGSAWKLCHDLYYLKHQSLRFDMIILARTFLALASSNEPGAPTLVPEARGAFSSYEPVPVASGE
jgi:exopolysaccharide biosynthesis polyprenyl glycosylphosphotransferase